MLRCARPSHAASAGQEAMLGRCHSRGSLLERSRRCGQWDFPSSHTSCTSFLHRWLDLKVLAFSLDCVSLGSVPSLAF